MTAPLQSISVSTESLFFFTVFFQFLRFFTIALFFHGFFWWLLRDSFTSAHRIQFKAFATSDILREVGYSMLTCFIFGVSTYVIVTAGASVDMKDLLSVSFGLNTLVGCIFLLLVYDAYFYWSHRLLHSYPLLRRIHAVHHKSTNPSAFAALSFHPIEAVIQIVWALPVYLLFPMSLSSWFFFILIATTVNVLGHCGVEFYPPSWINHPVARYLNFPTAHNGHHRNGFGNYGLFFSFWDRMMGTLVL